MYKRQAFGRTYDKNGVTDQAAAVIGCNKNSSVTVDVSTLWEDGSYIINTYDNSSSVVTDGKVTFNSGVNGTILMENADGQPLVSITCEPTPSLESAVIYPPFFSTIDFASDIPIPTLDGYEFRAL